MGWTKRQFIEAAYDEIGLANYVFDLDPEQLERACSRLDSMMAAWNGKGIRLGFPIGANPGTNNVDTVTRVPDSANEAIYANLALRLAAGVGKQVSAETRQTAKSGYTAMLSKYVTAIPVQQPVTMIAGQGNRRFDRRVFVIPPTETLDSGLDGNISDIEI